MRTIRASEISTFLYCQRAWWYQQRGEVSENLAQMAAGRELHEQHGRTVLTAGCFQVLAYALILAALILLTVYFANQVL